MEGCKRYPSAGKIEPFYIGIFCYPPFGQDSKISPTRPSPLLFVSGGFDVSGIPLLRHVRSPPFCQFPRNSKTGVQFSRINQCREMAGTDLGLSPPLRTVAGAVSLRRYGGGFRFLVRRGEGPLAAPPVLCQQDVGQFQYRRQLPNWTSVCWSRNVAPYIRW